MTKSRWLFLSIIPIIAITVVYVGVKFGYKFIPEAPVITSEPSASFLTDLPEDEPKSSADSGAISSEGLAQLPQGQDAIEQFQKYVLCENVASAKGILDEVLKTDVEGMSEEQLKEQNDYIKKWSEMAAFVEAHRDECGSTVSMQPSNIFFVTRNAALSGDNEAISCYISGKYAARLASVGQKEAARAQYQIDAESLGRRALEHGDWRTVDIFARAYSNYVSNPVVGTLVSPDKAQAYRMFKLISLGNPTISRRDFLNTLLPELRTEIGSEEARSGDDWASYYFERYFRNAGDVPELAEPCRKPMR